MDRTACIHHPTACEGCLAAFLQTGVVPERGCLSSPMDDGSREITILVKSGTSYGSLVINDMNREEIIYHGWMQFVRFPPKLFPAPESRDRKPP